MGYLQYMDNIIKKSENINLSGDDIYNIVDGQIKILSYCV